MTEPTLRRTERTRLRRLPERGSYDRSQAYAILDEGLVAHVGFAVDGEPFVVPMAYARDGDRLLLHGSAASRTLRRLAEGAEVAVTVTLLDGIVLARSAFHHSMNYRSVMLFGRALPIEDEAEKRAALDRLVEHLVPGRTADARRPTAAELRATLVVALTIDEGSVKIRTGPPVDDEADLDLPVWAGVVPVRLGYGEAVPAPDLRTRLDPPPYLRPYRRRGSEGTREELGG